MRGVTMKKTIVFIICSIFVASLFPSVYAEEMTPEAAKKAHFAEMKKIKDAQRQARLNAPKPQGPKGPTFWDKEGERSGFKQLGENIAGVGKNFNPVPFFKSQEEQYEARRAKAKAQGEAKKS